MSKVERLHRSKKFNFAPTNLMKVWFTTETLPEIIVFMAERFKVRPFVDKVYQCYNCQKFGHTASICTSQTKCVVCAGDHKLDNCPNRENGIKKCVNCGGEHTASFGKCNFIIKDRKAQELRANEGLSYSEAVKRVSKESERSNQNIIQSNNVSTRKPSNVAEIPAGRQQSKSPNLSSSQLCDTPPVIDARFLGFLFELIKCFQKPEPETDRFKAISDAYRLHYKGELNPDVLKEVNLDP